MTALDRRGLTLLEVLAAVVLLGTVFTVLAGAGMQGLQIEGEARRRLQASMIADRKLSDLELGLETGTAPRLGTEESEEDGFTVITEVTALSLDLPAPEGREEDERAPASSDESFLGGGGGRGAGSPLRRIDLRVRWGEGVGEREVLRTTFGFDAEAVRATLDQLDAAAEQEEAAP